MEFKRFLIQILFEKGSERSLLYTTQGCHICIIFSANQMVRMGSFYWLYNQRSNDKELSLMMRISLNGQTQGVSQATQRHILDDHWPTSKVIYVNKWVTADAIYTNKPGYLSADTRVLGMNDRQLKEKQD